MITNTDFAANLQNQQEYWRGVIEDIIADRGVYGEGLGEAYSGFAQLQYDSGDYQQAASLFKQAWQVSRVNSGLYSEDQLAHLNKLIKALSAMQEWEQVHELHQLSFLIASRVFPPDDMRYVIAAELYSEWKWEAIRENISFSGYANGFELAQELSAFYAEVIDKVENSGGIQTGRLARLIGDKARTDISLARTLALSPQSLSSTRPEFITETECVDSNLSRQRRLCRRVKLANYDLGGTLGPSTRFAQGRYLLQVEQSIDRLNSLKKSMHDLSQAERNWIDSLVENLIEESENLLLSTSS